MKPPKTQWTLQKPTFLPFQIWQKSCSSVFTAGFKLFEDERNLFCTSSRKTFSHFCTLQANWPPVKSAPACRSLFEDWRQLLQPGDGHVQVHPSQTEREEGMFTIYSISRFKYNKVDQRVLFIATSDDPKWLKENLQGVDNDLYLSADLIPGDISLPGRSFVNEYI